MEKLYFISFDDLSDSLGNDVIFDLELLIVICDSANYSVRVLGMSGLVSQPIDKRVSKLSIEGGNEKLGRPVGSFFRYGF